MKLMTTPRSTLSYVSPFAPLLNRDWERLVSGGSDLNSGFRPDLDVREEAEALTVLVDLPGVRREDVQVTFHDGELTITGERKSDAPEKQEVRSYQERSFGRFERLPAWPAAIGFVAHGTLATSQVMTLMMI
jgi:HSP20 family molecular chaperone IbpA